MLDVMVDGMTCSHCVHAVTEAVSHVPGVLGVAIDLATGHVQIIGDPDIAAIRAAIEGEGYVLR